MNDTSRSVPIFLPSFGASIEEGTIVSWNVSVGDAVRSGQVIAEIETDKALVELEATEDGVIDAIEIPEGGPAVPVGTTIARLTTTGADVVDSERPDARGSSPEPAPVVAAEAPESSSDTTARKVPQTDRDESGTTGTATPPPRARNTPRARRLARKSGRSIDEVAGSVPHGAVVGRDVQSMSGDARPGNERSDSNTASSPSQAHDLTGLGFAPGTYDVVPLTGMRKAIARRLSASFRDVPHFSLSVDVEMDPVMRHRQAANETGPTGSIKLSINDFVVWAAAAALKDVPEANSSYTEDGVLRHHHADIAVAVAVGGGLVTPVVRAAEKKSLREISVETRRLAERARARRLEMQELEGGTFTVSNLGMAGITSFTSVLNPPQGCILSVGAAEQRPVVRQGEIAVATVATMTLTCDHRVVDGVIGAEFLSALKSHLATPPSG